MIRPNLSKSATTVVVAMSGGVDSSTVAALLHAEGYRVIGLTLQLYDHGFYAAKKGACCAGQDIYDAKMVADRLGIPHYVLDYESKFHDAVIKDFADSYVRGETPLPCVRCNQSVKFKDLLEMAKSLGADALATGHYVRKTYGKYGPELRCGRESKKDQSYFLFTTTKEQLEYLEFPLGDMTKEETRKLAAEYGLTIADKPDSQDICFVPDGDYKKVVTKLYPNAKREGKILHVDGYELGKHNGIINYTIGQRRGLGIAFPEPLYVTRIDPAENIVYVGGEDNLKATRFLIKEINWLGDGKMPETSREVKVKIRSTRPGAYARIAACGPNEMMVELLSDEKAVSPGQACVIYDDDRVLGGGWITRDIV